MPTSRVIYYHNSQNAIEWAILSENQALEQASHAQSVDKIDNLDEKLDNIVLINSENSTIYRTDIPSQTPKQLKQAIPFALEDQLASDMSDCEFCLLKYQDNTQYSAVISKSFWQGLLTDCSGLTITHVIPDIYALPSEPNTWSALVTADRVLIRSGYYQGFCIAREALDYFLKESLQASEDKPKKLFVYSTEKLSLESPYTEVQVNKIEDEFKFLLEGLPSALSFNCLSQKIQNRNEVLTQLLPKITAGILGLSAVIFVLSLTLEYRHLSQVDQQYQSEIRQVYQQVFPNATQVIAPRVRFQRELKRLKENASGGKVQQLLQDIAPILLKAKQVKVNEARYADSELRLKMTASAITDFEQLSQAIKAINLNVEIRNASAQNKQASAEMVIKEK